MTDNKYWLYLEMLRRDGRTNMFGASAYLEQTFKLSKEEAMNIVADWMENYKREDYEGFENVRFCDICEKPIHEGFVVMDSDYYCSEKCLHMAYTEEEYAEMYDNGDAYWTQWEGC